MEAYNESLKAEVHNFKAVTKNQEKQLQQVTDTKVQEAESGGVKTSKINRRNQQQ